MSAKNVNALHTNLQVALDLAAAGIPVFPVGPDKRPKLKGWQDRATTDPRQIERLFTKWPDAMPAYPTGARSGRAVLDIDRHGEKDGFASLRAMGLDPDILSPVRVETPSVGLHLVFRWPEGMGNSAAGLPPGLDVRGEGGFVVAPGAVNGKGTYRLVSGSLSDPLPNWPEALRPRRGPVDPGEGKPTGLPLAVILSALRACPNDGDAFPGRDDWLGMGMALHAETSGSAEGREAWHDWSRQHPSYDPDATEATWDSFSAEGGISGWTIIREAERHGWADPAVTELRRLEALEEASADFTDDDMPEPITPEEEDIIASLATGKVAVAEDGELVTLSPDDCASFEPVPYVWKELVAKGDMVTVVGAPGVGKSVLAPHVAYAVAQGRPVCGKRTRRGPVLYLAAENDRDMQKRIAALRARHDACPDLHMLLGCGGKFREKDFLRKLKRLIQRVKPVLIVVDTLRAALPGIKENDSEGMGEAITTMRSLTKWGAAVLLVDHDNVAGSGLPRGHGSLHGDVDMNLALKRTDNGDVIGTPTKNRNGESFRPVLAYTIKPVGLDKLDEDGDPLTTVVCEERDVDEARAEAKEQRLADHPQTALAHLRRLSEGGKRAVPETEWRDAFMADAGEDEKPKSRQAAFRRAKDTLTERELIVAGEEGYSLRGICQPDPSEWTKDLPDPEAEE